MSYAFENTKNAGRYSVVLIDGASRANSGKKNNSAIVGDEQVILADLYFHRNQILISKPDTDTTNYLYLV